MFDKKYQREDHNVLELIWNHTSDAIFTIANDGEILNANPAFIDMLGWSIEDLKGIAYPPILTDMTEEEHQELLTQLRMGRDFPDRIMKRQGKGGRLLDVLASYRAVNANGILAVGMYKDCTEQISMQQQLEENEYYYRRLVDYLPEAIVKQRNGIINFVNTSGVQFFNQQQSKDIIGRSMWDFISSNRKDKIQEMIATAHDGDEGSGPSFQTEQFVTNDGRKIWVEIIVIPIGSKKKSDIQIVFRDITEKKRYASQLEFLAYHDPLTGFKNRRIFSEIVIDSIEEAKEKREKLAIMYIDIDKFKCINDTFGHGTGDEILQEFSNRLRACVYENDVICRIGGDEFLVLVKHVKSEKQVAAMADRMHAAFQKHYIVENNKLNVTASIGIAFFPKDGLDGKRLISRADQALYRAKEDRNTFMFYA